MGGSSKASIATTNGLVCHDLVDPEVDVLDGHLECRSVFLLGLRVAL